MILERGECVVFDTQEQEKEVLTILEEYGYNIHNGISPLCLGESTPAIRWWWEGEFPNCLATFNKQMVRTALSNKPLGHGEDKPYELITYNEFIDRVNHHHGVEVGDLL